MISDVVLFLILVVVSFIIVRIGAIAFQLTGLEWSLAKFQSLSCFTGTGFTTRESELVVSNPQRRRIATFLIVLGHAGFVTMIATFANSLRANITPNEFKNPVLKVVFDPHLSPLLNLIIICMGIYLIYRLLNNTRIAKTTTDLLKRTMKKHRIVSPVSVEELALLTGGFGVSQIRVCQGSAVLDKEIFASGLKAQNIILLAIIRNNHTLANPSPDTKILLNDDLICFGNLDNIRRAICTA